MSEKRIFIFTKKMLCEHCAEECDKYDGLQPDCDVCPYLKLPHLPRTEAVKVMGPAIYRALNKGIALDKPWEQIKKEMAEAALNALLGGIK